MRILCLLLTALLLSDPSLATSITERRDVSDYLDQVSQQHHFDRQQLNQLFSHVHIRPRVIKSMDYPYESRSWDEYRHAFVNPKRIQHGIEYYHQHQVIIDQIATKYHVPGSILVAFMGIESNYGRYQAQYPTLDSLATLGFSKRKRSGYFRSELTELLLLCREQHFDPLKIGGSYAGALGMPQFMPSSYRQFAVDWDHHHHADLFHNPADVMASISNYLNHFGWQSGQPVAVKACTDSQTKHPQIWRDLVHPNPVPAKQLTPYHLTPSHVLPGDTPVRVIGLTDKHGNYTYWLGLTNLNPILRYNNSTQYALSVMLLANAIQQRLS